MMDFGTRGGQILSCSFGKSIQGLLFVSISKNCGFLLSRVSEAVIAHHVGCSGGVMISIDQSICHVYLYSEFVPSTHTSKADTQTSKAQMTIRDLHFYLWNRTSVTIYAHENKD